MILRNLIRRKTRTLLTVLGYPWEPPPSFYSAQWRRVRIRLHLDHHRHKSRPGAKPAGRNRISYSSVNEAIGKNCKPCRKSPKSPA